jgi:hypothetical protein
MPELAKRRLDAGREDVSEPFASGCAPGVMRAERPDTATLGAAAWLGLAASPTFAIMALLTSVSGGAQPVVLCSPAQGTFPLSDMVLMYVLMSAFHLAPWLNFLTRRRPMLH